MEYEETAKYTKQLAKLRRGNKDISTKAGEVVYNLCMASDDGCHLKGTKKRNGDGRMQLPFTHRGISYRIIWEYNDKPPPDIYLLEVGTRESFG